MIGTQSGTSSETPGTETGSGFSFTKVPRAPRLSREEANSVYVDAAGVVWYGCGESLCRLEADRAREIGTEQGLPPDRWEALLGDLGGNLWVRSERALYLRPAGASRFQLKTGLPESTNTYPTLALDPSGRLLVPTYRGLERQSGSGWELIQSSRD